MCAVTTECGREKSEGKVLYDCSRLPARPWRRTSHAARQAVRARAATPPTVPPTMAPMSVLFEEGLSVSASGVVVWAGELLVVLLLAVLLDVDVVEVEVVLAEVSRAACGSSSIYMKIGSEKQRYIDRGGLPVHRKVPHAPNAEDSLAMVRWRPSCPRVGRRERTSILSAAQY